MFSSCFKTNSVKSMFIMHPLICTVRNKSVSSRVHDRPFLLSPLIPPEIHPLCNPHSVLRPVLQPAFPAPRNVLPTKRDGGSSRSVNLIHDLRPRVRVPLVAKLEALIRKCRESIRVQNRGH